MPPFDQFLHWRFVANVLSIAVVDMTLSGDNAVVIAAAAKSLPPTQRRRAMMAGAACAVLALVVAAFFATRLLEVKFLQLIGGLAILWIAVSLFREEPPLEESCAHVTGFWKAMWFIVVADVTMSTDNVLAIAGIAQGNIFLLLFGLSVSIPMVIFASGLIAKLMDNYPAIIYIGAALLGRVAGQMIMTDGFTVQMFAPTARLKYAAEVAGVILVLAVGFWVKRRTRQHPG